MRTIHAVVVCTVASVSAFGLDNPCFQQQGRLRSYVQQRNLLPKKRTMGCIFIHGTRDCGVLTGTRNENDAGQDLPTLSVEDVDELDEETLEEIEAGQPSEWMVMKEILGINVFTYMLAAAIAFFLGMNAILGPGWLGNALGILSGWDLTETSKSLPDAIDLSNPDYRL